MKFREIAEKVKDGTITLDCKGHNVFYTDDLKKEVLEQYQELLELEAGGNDGKWGPLDEEDTLEQVDARMRDFHKKKLDHEFNDGDPIKYILGFTKCSGCAERLVVSLNGNKLELRHYWNGPHRRWDFHPIDYVCPYASPKSTTGEIKVNSRLIFANFFRDFANIPEEIRYQDAWSLNFMIGIENTTQFKAEHNVACCQMGNMSIGVYLHADKKSIIIGATYLEEDENASLLLNGYEMVGDICLDMWRWEATDFNTLGAEVYERVIEENGDRGVVELDVPHGIWQFEHFYTSNTGPDPHIYSKLVLKT